MFVLVVRNNMNPKAIEASILLSAYLDSLGCRSSFIESSTLYELGASSTIELPDDVDMAVVLGGDGTMLHTAKLLCGRDVPILGINFGSLGFLANDGESGVIELVSEALAGELVQSDRANLKIEVLSTDFDEEKVADIKDVEVVELDGEKLAKRDAFALNEIVITKGALGRTISYALEISGIHIADVSGDGVIISTSTGSTAYALAAGGPIVNPSFNGMIVQPLAPHTLSARAVLSDSSDVISIDLSATREGREASLFLDGDELAIEGKPKIVRIIKGPVPTRLLYKDGSHFYKYCESTFFKS